MQKALLGKKLFFDTRLSKDNTISCASCHILNEGGDDNQKLSFGVNGKVGTRNSPTVYNAVFNFAQFWDGNAKDLKEQISGPIHNPVEMDSNFKHIVESLKKDTSYVNTFKKLFFEGINENNIKEAIVEFEKALITPNSKFDRYLKGENSLTPDEFQGYTLFKEYGCISCHNGVNLGGNLFQKIGIINETHQQIDDLGRYIITKKEEDKYFFKVPTLRNIALTAPYLHDGSIDDLKKVINLMATHQIGVMISEEEIDQIDAFLHTLTGEIPTEKGEGGFGYDPLFIPKGFDTTLGELPHDIKKKFSHRSQALHLALKVLKVLV